MDEITQIVGTDKVFFGEHKEWKERIYISKPKLYCGWYWGFGYLGNKNRHYHLDGYQNIHRVLRDDKGKLQSFTEQRNMNMFDALQADYELNPVILDNLWEFCELVETIYILEEAAEVFSRGGAHYTENPMKDILKDKDLYEKLTFDLIPKQCQILWDLISNPKQKEG